MLCGCQRQFFKTFIYPAKALQTTRRFVFWQGPSFTLIKFHSVTPDICPLQPQLPQGHNCGRSSSREKQFTFTLSPRFQANDLSVLIIHPEPLNIVALMLLYCNNNAMRAHLNQCVLRAHYFLFSFSTFMRRSKLHVQ